MESNLHLTAVVLGAVEDINFPVADDGGGIERMQRFPADGSASHGAVKQRVLVRRDHGVAAGGTRERSKLPTACGRGEDGEQQRGEYESRSLSKTSHVVTAFGSRGT